MRYIMLGETKDDKVVLLQIQGILSQPVVDKDCKTPLAKVNELYKTFTSEAARKEALAMVNDFKAKNCPFDLMDFLKSPPGMMVAGAAAIVLLMLLKR